MSNNSKVLRNTLISLAFAAAVPAAWADDPVNPPASPPKFSVKAADSVQTPRLLRVLDLKSPDIHDVMSADEIAAALPPDEMEDMDPETVQVHGATPAPYVPGGFAALYWGVTHPLQAWRVLAPVQ